MEYNKLFQSKTFKIVILAIAGFIVIFLIFGLGMSVGFKKASFSYGWGENYHRNFAGPKGGFFGEFKEGDFIDAHGVFGQIMKIEFSTSSEQIPSATSGQEIMLILRGRDNVEKIVLVQDSTVITRFKENVKSADLKIDDYVVVIGEPNNKGQIEAKFIRIMPSPPFSEIPSNLFPMMRGR